MKRLLLLPAVLLSLFALVSAATAEEKAPNKPPEGFTALFNGKDVTNWKGLVGNPKSRAKMSPEELAKAQEAADKSMKQHWKADNGILVYDGKGESLCTAKDYADFELLVDWKIDAHGDSGIYLRGMPQVQIWDPSDPSQKGNGADKGSGSLWNNKNNPRFPLVKADNPIGEWNTFRIKMVGEKVTIHLNDKLVTDNVTMEDYQDNSKTVPSSGQIELQHHSHPLYFRNIYIKELPAK